MSFKPFEFIAKDLNINNGKGNFNNYTGKNLNNNSIGGKDNKGDNGDEKGNILDNGNGILNKNSKGDEKIIKILYGKGNIKNNNNLNENIINIDDGKGKSEDNIKDDKNHFNSVDGKGDLKDKMENEEDDKENCENFHKKSENSPFNILNRVELKGITNQGGESYSDSFGGKGTTDLFSDYSKIIKKMKMEKMKKFKIIK